MLYQSKKFSGVFYSLLNNGDKTYYIKYYVEGKQYKKKIGRHSEGVRENFCFTKRSEYINNTRFGDNTKSNITLDALAEEYHNTKLANTTYEDMISRYDFKIKPFFKNKLVSKIKEDDVYKFQSSLMRTKTGAKGVGKRTMSPSTVNYYITQIASMFRFAVSRGYISKNVATNVRSLKEDNSRDRYLQMSELEELVDTVNLDSDILMFVELSMSTGGRMSAVMSVCKKDVNLKNRSVQIEDEKGGGYYTAFLNDRVLVLLKEKMKNLKPNSRLYTANIRRMQRQMKRILDTLFNKEIHPDDARNRVVIHTLRHTFASHLAINGTPIFTIQKLLNHKDIKQTMRYAKLSPNSGRDDVGNIWH